MKKVKFKKALFGFKRRQVLAYVDSTCAEYEQRLTQQETAYNEHRSNLENQLQELAHSLENSRIVCAEQEQALEQADRELAVKEQSLAEAAALANDLLNRLQSEETARLALGAQLEASQKSLTEKDGVIANQSAQMVKLQQQVAQFESEFMQLRDQAEQSSSLVNCLNLLHDRNRALIAKIAKLETRLEEVTFGNAVKEHNQTMEQKQQMIQSTEELFSALRKEIGDALDSISSKIESGSIRDTDDGNYYVDMANL